VDSRQNQLSGFPTNQDLTSAAANSEIAVEFAEDEIDEERTAWLDCFLRIIRYTGLPGTLGRLERHMEIEPHYEQLSRPGFDYFDFGGRRVSL
jgi:hypothetical protein